MKFISLFSGVGGLDLGLERAGFECVGQVEIDDACQKILAKHWPHVPRYKDVRDVKGSDLSAAQLVCGGFPCQDVSLAGDRAGLEGKRSTLWSEFYRIVCEVRPKWVLIENVLGLLSSDDGRFFSRILRNLSEGGYDAEWLTLSAAAFGASHLRERVFILAYPQGQRLDGERPHEGYLSYPDTAARFGWPPEPQVARVAHGIPGQLDRIRMLGNAVVPVVAEHLGRCILKASQ